MSEYPEDLMQKLLDAVLDKPAATTPSLKMFAADYEDDVQDARLIITQVLDALGLRREFRHGIRPEQIPEGAEPAKRRYVTEWEGV